MSNISILNLILMIAIVSAGFLAIIIEDGLPSVIALSMVAVFASIEFLFLGASIMAFAEAFLGIFIIPIIFVITLNKIKNKIENKIDIGSEGEK